MQRWKRTGIEPEKSLCVSALPATIESTQRMPYDVDFGLFSKGQALPSHVML